MARRCVDGGAGLDGCVPSPTLQLGKSDEWLARIQADSDRYHGLIGAVMTDALRRWFDLDPGAVAGTNGSRRNDTRIAERRPALPTRTPVIDPIVMRGERWT